MIEQGSPRLTYLDQDLQPLKEYFNTYPDKLRFLALLSPT